MKITPVASPAAVQQPAPTDKRSAAIAAFKGAAPMPHTQTPNQVVQNQNNISPEEVGAIKAATNRQLASNEDTSPDLEANTNETQVTDLQQETPQVEETPVETPESRRFAQLARQEKDARIKMQRIQAQEQALAKREAELKAKESSLQIPPTIDQSRYIERDRFKQDPIQALQDLGLTYEEITNQFINQTPRDPRVDRELQELKATIKSFQEQQEEAKKQQVESQTQQYQQAVAKITTDVKNLVSKDPSFETIKATNSIKDVVSLIEKTYHEEGYVMSVEDAAAEVESYLEEKLTNYATKINKIKAKLTQSNASKPSAPVVKTSTDTEQPKQPQPMKTLTNSNSSVGQLSAKQRAILAFKGQLK